MHDRPGRGADTGPLPGVGGGGVRREGTPSAWSIDNHAFRTWLPHKQLGLCYYQLGDYRRSLHHNEQAQAYLPDNAEILTNIGVLKDLIRD